MKFFGLAVLFLASIGFVFLGMGDLRFGNRDITVAQVAGHDITQTEWDNAHRQDIDEARNANPALELSILDTPATRYASLQRLVRRYVEATAAQKDHLMVSDNALAEALQQEPAIAALRGADGQLDMKGYERLLAAQGLTPQGFEEDLRARLSRQQVLAGVLDSGIASQAQVDVAVDASLERREARVVHFKTADYAAQVKPDADQLKQYYDAHVAQYQAPETVDLEYVVLDLAVLERKVPVSEQQLRDYYAQNAAQLGKPEERRASHILVAAPSGAPPAELDKAKAKAEQLLAQVRAHPDTFAEVAKKSSDDDVSAKEGGDLGFFQKDRGMDPALADATFKLAKVGDISGLVQTEFGYHILQLTAIQPSEVPPFEEVREKLEQQFRQQQAESEFSEMAEEFTNGVYEQPDSLQPVADKLGLEIQTAKGVTRQPPPTAVGALAHPRFLAAVFSPDVLKNDNNTETVEIGPNTLAAGHVTGHTEAHARPFEEVKEEVRAAYVTEQASAAARAAGEAQLKEWSAAPQQAADLPAAQLLSRQDPAGEPPALVAAVLRADATHLPTFVGIDLGSEGYAIAQVEKVLPPAPLTKEQEAQNRAGYERLWTLAEATSYYDYLQARYKAKILVPRPGTGDAEEDGGP